MTDKIKDIEKILKNIASLSDGLEKIAKKDSTPSTIYDMEDSELERITKILDRCKLPFHLTVELKALNINEDYCLQVSELTKDEYTRQSKVMKSDKFVINRFACDAEVVQVLQKCCHDYLTKKFDHYFTYDTEHVLGLSALKDTFDQW